MQSRNWLLRQQSLGSYLLPGPKFPGEEKQVLLGFMKRRKIMGDFSL